MDFDLLIISALIVKDINHTEYISQCYVIPSRLQLLSDDTFAYKYS